MDKIIIKEARFSCNIGVSQKERKKKQEIAVDAQLFLDAKKAAQTDDIKYAVNYSEVHDLIKNIIGMKKYKLAESIAENIARGILNEFPVQKVIVKVKKPEALADRNVKYAAVEIIRKKQQRKK